MAYKVFISHSGVDTGVAKLIEAHIKRLKIDTFLDEEGIEVGADFEMVIRKELKSSNEILVLFTPSALGRPYIWLEIGAAWNQGIRIVGILYGINFDKLHKNPKVPELIKKNNLIEINQLDKYFTQLRKRAIA